LMNAAVDGPQVTPASEKNAQSCEQIGPADDIRDSLSIYGMNSEKTGSQHSNIGSHGEPPNDEQDEARIQPVQQKIYGVVACDTFTVTKYGVVEQIAQRRYRTVDETFLGRPPIIFGEDLFQIGDVDCAQPRIVTDRCGVIKNQAGRE